MADPKKPAIESAGTHGFFQAAQEARREAVQQQVGQQQGSSSGSQSGSSDPKGGGTTKK